MPPQLVKRPSGSSRRPRTSQISAPPPVIPPSPDRVQVWIDFDGTITRKDVLDELIVQFAVDDSWQQIEAQWRAGEIGSLDCLQREFALVRVGKAELNSLVDEIPIDPGFVPLVKLLRARGAPLAILSDGVEQFIRSIVARSGAGDVTIRSNRMEHVGQRLTLLCPRHDSDCAARAAHCKCASAAQLSSPDRTWIYIGDGLSDLCPARRSQVVFAKGALARQLEAEAFPFIRFDTLLDVQRALTQAWACEAGA